MSQKTVHQILSLWPSRRGIHDDVVSSGHAVDLVAIHRWFSRGSVPPQYWWTLVAAAKRRGLKVTSDDFAKAHSLKSPMQAPSTDASRSEFLAGNKRGAATPRVQGETI